MKAIKAVEKIVSDNTSFLKNKFNLEVSEIKFFLICTEPLNCIKMPPSKLYNCRM